MKKTMKKVIAAMVSAAMLLPLAACGNSNATSATAPAAAASSDGAAAEKKGGDGTGSPGGVDHTQGASFKIRFATNSSAGDVAGEGISQTGKGMIYFCKQIEERSGGRITTQIFTDGQLASSTQEYIGGAQNGAYEMFMLNCGSWADYTPAYAGLNIPYLYMDYDDAYAVLDSQIRQEWDQRAQADTKCIPLAHLDIGFRQLTANKEIHAPADLKGVKIRTMVDPIQMNCWEAFGASVTPVPYAELYTALQQKLVDAQENPPSNIVSSKLYEMQSYCMKTNHNFTTTIMAASPVFWDTLSEEDKVFLQELWKETEMYVRSLTENLSDGFFDEMQSKGTTVVELTTDELKVFQDVAKSVWPQVEEQMGSEAYNKLVDFVMDYQANK
ncbi:MULTISPECIES: TRAP transporter substrate-binding protein [unclassified Clostridium]|uniref:TRAP transporter substrate-binding protein n=1 Tax=unclassified Clostridium TaxID=2614128 RepID=UPI0011065506|nr:MULTISPECIES: TRAP transporter substrate-binding protein [unclassified Clostridium]